MPSKKSPTSKQDKSTLSTSSFEKVIRDNQANNDESSASQLLDSSNHWSRIICECPLPSKDVNDSDLFLSKIKGGSDNNQFIYLDSDASYLATTSSSLEQSSVLGQFDIILEVDNYKVSGFTFNDIVKLLEHLAKKEDCIKLRSVKSQLSQLVPSRGSSSKLFNSSLLPLELNKFLEEPFQKGSVEYDLQQTIRENVYKRTVPCTTRPPRPGEVHGQDYVFLSNEEFINLKNNSLLLEYGFYNGFMYGTPIPPPQPRALYDKTNASLNENVAECAKVGQLKILENNESKQSGGGETIWIVWICIHSLNVNLVYSFFEEDQSGMASSFKSSQTSLQNE